MRKIFLKMHDKLIECLTLKQMVQWNLLKLLKKSKLTTNYKITLQQRESFQLIPFTLLQEIKFKVQYVNMDKLKTEKSYAS